MSHNIQGAFGRFHTQQPASYTITDRSMQVPWEYIYQNRDMLLRVDQYGPVNAQANPPQDIMLFKRERDDKFSKWLFWLQCDNLNNGLPFTNFWGPTVGGAPNLKPDETSITFHPEQAIYQYRVGALRMTTTLFVPRAGADIVCKLTLENLGDTPLAVKATSIFAAYVNPAALAPWDKPEWYLKSGVSHAGELAFWSQLFNSGSVREKRRVAALWCSAKGAEAYEISLEKFVGEGDLSNPQAIYAPTLRLGSSDLGGWAEYTDTNHIYGYPPAYGVQYPLTLASKSTQTLSQVLSLLPLGEDFGLPTLETASRSLQYFDAVIYEQKLREQQDFFGALFQTRAIKTADSFFDYYVNTWLPLQMYWVSSLDRGWPTGMRGTRDCANDFMGQVYFDAPWSREILELVLSCQRTDGWFPRQVSTAGRTGTHDLRPFVDAAAFVLEFAHEYFCVTGDTAFLDTPLKWLDDETESTVFVHLLRALDYYTDPENIGEHGLCKIRGGDWLDAVNRAGLQGRGETVMVTCQALMGIEFVLKIADFAKKPVENRARYEQAAQSFRNNLQTHALNKSGFFNSVFTDNGEWVFSDCDPDGESRPSVCPNAYAIIAGVATPAQRQSILEVYERLKCETGYRLFYPGIGAKPIANVGRSGSGDGPIGLFENATPYNHGSHGFLGRSFSVANQPEKLFDALMYMLPYDQNHHNTDEALSPPYAVVNCWQRMKLFNNRGGMTFLTGTIAMGLRMVYNWMLGIQPDLDGLVLAPCLSTKLGDVAVTLTLRGKTIHLTLKQNATQLTVNGQPITTIRTDPFSGRQVHVIDYDLLQDVNEVVFE